MNRECAIGHLDADSFYVSAERVRDPYLRGKPVGVLGNNGACVIARSYEMKKYGVRVGEPIWEAVKRCPQGIYIKRDFHWYEVLSRKMLEIIRSKSSQVEYYAIDEFFFIVRPSTGQTMEEFCKEVRDDILLETGLPVTAAIARSRTLAKLMTDTFKPFGTSVMLTRAEEEEFLGRLPIDAVSGIARRRAARLAPYQVHTCLDFCRLRRTVVKQLLTVVGETLWRELHGEAVIPIQMIRPAHKMLSRGGSVGWATSDEMVICAWLVRHLERLIEELHYHEVHTQRITVWFGHQEGPDGVGEYQLDSPSNLFDHLLVAVQQAAKVAWTGAAVSRMSIIASQLTSSNYVQQSLFDQPSERQESLAYLKKNINQHLGRFTVRSGATLPLYEIYHDRASNYEICDIHDKFCF